MTRTALVTGSAGFIGYFTAKALLDQGWRVVGLDAMTDYYDVRLKDRRHAMLHQNAGFSAVNARLETPGVLQDLFETHQRGNRSIVCQSLPHPEMYRHW